MRLSAYHNEVINIRGLVVSDVVVVPFVHRVANDIAEVGNQMLAKDRGIGFILPYAKFELSDEVIADDIEHGLVHVHVGLAVNVQVEFSVGCRVNYV